MFFLSELNLKDSTLALIGCISTVLGILFIVFSNFIGDFVIRVLAIVTLIFLIGLLKMKYPFLKTLNKISTVLAIIGTVIAIIWPNLLVFIVGIAILYFSILNLYKVYKDKAFVNYFGIAISVIGILFSLFCIFRSGSAKDFIIIVIGIFLIMIGCLGFYTLFKNKSDNR